MSASAEFVEYVRELLSPLGPLADARFFGGHAFKTAGRQFAMIMGNTLYLRVDDTTRPRYAARGMQPFSYATRNGRVEVRTYFAVPEALLEDPEALCTWATEAIEAAGRRGGTRSRIVR